MTQICRYCATEIPAAARKCPNCHAWLSRWLAPLPRAIAFILLMLVFLTPSVMMLYWPEPNFADHEADLRIVESTFSYQPCEPNSRGSITLIGTLRNDGDVTWRSPQIEVHYFDRTKTRIDTVTDADYDLRIRPGQEVHFRVLGSAARQADAYVSHSVRIRNADAQRAWP